MNKHDHKLSDHDKIAGLYNIGKTIGKGHYAVVKEAKHVFTEEKVAIKVIDKTKLDSQSREHLFSEVMCMKLVQHPNVVRLYEVIDTASKLYLVLELGDAGDLYDYIMKYENGLPENQAKKYFRQIVQAISYCHNLHVVHRDLKPENVVFFEKLEIVKLTDFGFSNKFIPGQTLQTSCGSLAYSAPEILLGDAYDAPKVDIWSLGVILFMLVCGRLPFNEVNDSETLSHIMDCQYDLPSKLSISCQNLIKSMLVRAPEQRASLEQILAHEWIGRDFVALGDSFSVPLISQQHLSVEEHVDILTKMSEGNLASVEDIQVNLDHKEYSYITATYFLLAERKLKRRHYEQFCKMKLLQMESESECEPEIIVATSSSIPDTNEERIRRFSMILEDEEVEEEEEEFEAMLSLASVREELSLGIPPVTEPINLDHDIVNTSVQFPRCRSAIYQSQSLSSIDDRKPLKSRHRQSLPGQTMSTANNQKRRSFPAIYCNFSPNRSISDISDNDTFLLRGYTDKQRISVPKSFGKHFLVTHPKYYKPLTPDWMNSNSSIESDGSRYYYPRRLRIKSSTATTNSRPNSMGATMNLSLSSDDDDVNHRQPMLSLSNSPTTGNITTLHRDICAPIHEEDELIRSRSYIDKDTSTNIRRDSNLHSFRSVSIDCRRRSESTDGTPAKWMSFLPQTRYQSRKLQHSHKVDSRSLSSQLTQSNFSLSSFASSVRDSKAMMNVVRGAFELQCLANKMRQNDVLHTSSGRYEIVSSSANVSGRQSRCEFTSVSSLPVAKKLHSPDDPESCNIILTNKTNERDATSSPTTFVTVVHSEESLVSKNVSTKTSTLANNGGMLIKASSTVTRKARFMLSCCRTS